MYVMDVIEKSDRLYPNEYSTDEKIGWIDDLNKKIAQEYRKVYLTSILTPDTDGEYLLPEDVTWERVYAIRSGIHEIKKEDFTTYGIRFLYDLRGRLDIPVSAPGGNGVIQIIYRAEAEKIRIINLDNVKIRLAPNGFYIDREMFEAGDVLNIRGKDDTADLDKNINVFSCYLPENGEGTEFFIECEEGVFSAYPDGTETEADIHRIITDKTLCEPPYDDMYIQWVCAKICFWQKAFDGHNQHMTMFNQILSDYSHMIVENTPSNSRTQWQGWF